jgi:hypothetical protein
MKRSLSIIGMSVLAIMMAVFTTSCSLTEGQMKVIAQNAGLAASITWIAYDAPDAEAKELVSNAMDIVGTNLVDVSVGKTYMEVMFPKIDTFVRSDLVPDQYEPLVLAGSMAALNGIDLLFVMNPEWKAKEEITVGIVNSFINGAKTGLALDDSDPRIIQANDMTARRARVFKQ